MPGGVSGAPGDVSAAAGDGPATDFWEPLRRTTQARIGLGRSGDSLPTRRVLEFAAAHALARDAVHEPLDVEALQAGLAQVGAGGAGAGPAGGAGSESGAGPALVVRSQAADRSEYLRRPDLGRAPADLAAIPATDADIGVVFADGLSARALTDHGAGLYAALLEALSGYTIAPPVIALQARVALGDHIGAALGVSTVLVLIGERPGLSVADSIGIYLTHKPQPGRTDADRNCISNVHPPDGLGYAGAARIVAGLVSGARQLGRSGVALKDTSREAELPPAP